MMRAAESSPDVCDLVETSNTRENGGQDGHAWSVKNSTGAPTDGSPGNSECAWRTGMLDPRFEIRRDVDGKREHRGVYALEPIAAGTGVLVGRSVAAIPQDRYRSAFCCRCLTLLDKTKMIKCRRCDDCFCGKECVIAAAGEGTHEITCAFLEDLGADYRQGFCPRPAASEADMLRLMVNCLARRHAGLSDDDDWSDIGSLDGLEDERVEGTEPETFYDAQAKLLRSRSLEVTWHDVQKLHARLRRNFHLVQPEPLGRLLPTTVLAVFPAASVVNHSCQPNALFHVRRREGKLGLDYVLRCTEDVAAGEEICVSYVAHFVSAAAEGRRELLDSIWGITCDCARCEADIAPGSSSADWRVTEMLEKMEALLAKAQELSDTRSRAELRHELEQGLQLLIAGPDTTPRLKLQLAMRIDQIAARRRIRGSLRFRSVQEVTERLIRDSLDNGCRVDLLFELYREALRWARDARLEGNYRRGEQMTRASRENLEEAIKVASIYFGEDHPKTRALIECSRRLSPLHSV